MTARELVAIVGGMAAGVALTLGTISAVLAIRYGREGGR